jgi:cytidylate kinase
MLAQAPEGGTMGKQLSEGMSGSVHLVERQMLLHEERSKLVQQQTVDELTDPFHFITISRDIGALGDAVASELAARLTWKVYDKELVDYIAGNSHVRRNLVDQLDEKTQSALRDSIDRLLLVFQERGFSSDEYHFALINALVTLAAQGQCILLGHGGAYALQGQAGLHLRMTASLPVRIRRLSKRWNISIEKTREIIQKTDAVRRDFIQRHFRPDRNDMHFFHLVFNTDNLTVDCIVAAVLGIIEQSKKQLATIQSPVFESLVFKSSEQTPG